MGRLILFLSLTLRTFAAGTTVRFDPQSPDTGPFPTDALTLADSEQKTGRRMDLPLPDCEKQPSSCSEINQLNRLDGFNPNPRLRVRFSGPVDIATLREGLVLVAFENRTDEEPGIHKTGDLVAVNQVVYDPATHTAYAKPDSVLDQHRTYLLAVTDAVKDEAGDAVMADAAYTICAQGSGEAYCGALSAAVRDAADKLAPRRIVAASIFTTLSATAWLESARRAIEAVSPAVTLAEPKATHRIVDLAALTINQQTASEPARFSSFSLPLDPALLQGLGSVTVASFKSPNFLDERQSIAPQPTGTPVKAPAATNEVFFNLLLPETAKPPSGYPVVIFGHGFGDSRLGGPTAVAPVLTNAGFAVIAINAVGHGFGPQSTVTFKEKEGRETTLRSGGRSVDLDRDGRIGPNEGCVSALGARDCFRQTVVDLMQLVRAIRGGIDIDGDGFPEVDAERIYYGGQSLGAIYGTIFNAVEPYVRAAALNVGGGSIMDIGRWSASYRAITTESLRQRTPSLLNIGDGWDEDYVLRDQPTKRVTVAGAVDIQNYFEVVEWLSASGDAIPFAPHLTRSPLIGMTAKPVLVQFARGDRTVPNPQNSALIRAAGLRENTWMYRHDLASRVATALGGNPLPVNPHAYLVLFVDLDGESIKLAEGAGLIVSGLAQGQLASFYAADGATIPDPNNPLVSFVLGAPLFEVPTKLPEDFNYQ